MSIKKLFASFYITVVLIGCSSLVRTNPQIADQKSLPINSEQEVPTESSSLDLLSPVTSRTAQIMATLQETGIEAIHFGETITPLENPSWSHDGTMVAFSQSNRDISIVNTNTWQENQTVCEVMHHTDLVWSPDDKKIAFNSNLICTEEEDCISKTIIQQCELATGEISYFPNMPEDINHVLDWYENKILLRNDSFVIYNTDTYESLVLDLSFMEKRSYRTAYFIDDNHILYMGNEIDPNSYNGTGKVNPSIYIATIETLELEKVIDIGDVSTNNPFYVASISPNGRWVMWMSVEKTENGRVTKLNAFDTETRLTTILLEDTNISWSFPSWSPNSQQLIFNENGEIVILNLVRES